MQKSTPLDATKILGPHLYIYDILGHQKEENRLKRSKEEHSREGKMPTAPQP